MDDDATKRETAAPEPTPVLPAQPHAVLLEPAPAAAPAPPSEPARPSLLERLPGYVVPLILIGVPLLVALLAKLAPSQVYDGFIWRYIWGPIHADAAGYSIECLRPDGSIFTGLCGAGGGVETHSGYNLVNTASWALLLGLCIIGLGQMLQKLRAKMDSRLIIAATLWVVAGSLFHVLEDAQLMASPLQYFFITPIIYLVFAALGILSFVIGHYLRVVAERTSVAVALQKLWMILAIPILGYLFLELKPWGQVNHYLNPILVALFAVVPFAIASWRFQRIGRIEPGELVAYLSIGWILLGVAYVLEFARHPWPSYPGTPNHVLEALLAPLLALAVVVIVRFIARARLKANPLGAAAFLLPINGLLLFSQMLDAFATAIGIDLGGYHEKHVLSAGLIDRTRDIGAALHIDFVRDHPTFFGFAPVKLVVSLLVIYAIDVSSPKESQKYPTLIGLVKFAIIMVGIGPGIRDFVRMALGI